MTRQTNARIAGVTFLAYVAAGITQMLLLLARSGGNAPTGVVGCVSEILSESSLS